MRIGTVARLAGVSTRTIRHYHQVGVLREPGRSPAGYRIYEVSDVVHLLRLRQLTESGVPLRRAAAVLGEVGSDSVSELEAVADGVRRQLRSLEEHLARLDALADRLRSGEPLGQLPRAVADALRQCIADADAAGEPRVAELVRRERDMLEWMALSSPTFPEGVADAYSAVGEDSALRARYLGLVRDFDALEGRSPETAADEIRSVVEGILSEPVVLTLLAAAGEGGPASSDPRVDDLVPDAAQAAAVADVIAALEDGSASAGSVEDRG